MRSTPRRPQQNRKESGGRAAPDALRGRRPSKFGCAPPKVLLNDASFSQNSKVEKGKIEILVGIRIFVERFKSLLPMLGRSANLSEPWAPRKGTSRSLVHGAKHSKAKCINFGRNNRRPQNYVGEDQTWGGPGSIIPTLQFLAINLLLEAVERYF